MLELLGMVGSFFGGGALRMVPEVLKFFTAGRDQKHELRMMDKQIEMQVQLGKQQVQAVEIQSSAATEIAAYEAIAKVTKPIGIRWVDALNASFRPIVSYLWVGLYMVVKVCIVAMFIVALFKGLDQFRLVFREGLNAIWTAEDKAVLATIIGFWFMERSLGRKGR